MILINKWERLSMNIEVDYSVGSGGEVSVVNNGEVFGYTITEFDENDYADIGIEIDGHGKSEVLNNVYNRNSLPGHDDVSGEEYHKIFTELNSEIVGSIESVVESFFR